MTCPSGKKCYGSRSEAKRVERKLYTGTGKKRLSGSRLRAYLCHECRCWHLTKDRHHETRDEAASRRRRNERNQA